MLLLFGAHGLLLCRSLLAVTPYPIIQHPQTNPHPTPNNNVLTPIPNPTTINHNPDTNQHNNITKQNQYYPITVIP